MPWGSESALCLVCCSSSSCRCVAAAFAVVVAVATVEETANKYSLENISKLLRNEKATNIKNNK